MPGWPDEWDPIAYGDTCLEGDGHKVREPYVRTGAGYACRVCALSPQELCDTATHTFARLDRDGTGLWIWRLDHGYRDWLWISACAVNDYIAGRRTAYP